MRYLNVGCGQRFCRGWVNIDLVARNGVLVHDLRKELPFADESFDVVYHSHVLEHFEKPEAPKFLKECRRVLKANGTLRVAVPDLEMLVKNYLSKLETIRNGSDNKYVDYEWAVIHLLDQLVRTRPGGEMAQFLSERIDYDVNYIKRICGDEVAEFARMAKASSVVSPLRTAGSTGRPGGLISSIRRATRSFRSLLERVDWFPELEFIRQARFRSRGEVHKWMYDDLSLKALLTECGFREVARMMAFESVIPNWSSYNLDTNDDGTIFRTDSLYMEAKRQE